MTIPESVFGPGFGSLPGELAHERTIRVELNLRFSVRNAVGEARFDDHELIRAQPEWLDVPPDEKAQGIKRFLVFSFELHRFRSGRPPGALRAGEHGAERDREYGVAN